ncbi:MAG: biotin transporter BioY [Actinobacteria bacterium]|jgi:biotin transport system substrate-specific component|nr:MAG: biotin transporter BioY [Actinomycetota bacterium]
MLARALLFAALTGIGALLRIPTSPVPVTMQVFFVLLSGMILGPYWGALSQVLYLGMGLCGAPFFAAPPYAGPAVLFGPTGGYLWGFILAAAASGWTSRRLAARERFPGMGYLLAGIVGIAAIYSCGTAWLGAWLSLNGAGASAAFALGVKPFILVDLLKALGAATLARTVPRKWSLTV